MAHLNHELPQKLFSLLKTAVNLFLLIILFYTLQYIFDMEFVCSCKRGGHPNGALYIILPPLILTLVVRIIQPFREATVFPRWVCPTHRWCTCLLRWVFTYIGMGALWLSSVLFDGDWYYCLLTNLNPNQTGLPCRKELTYEEQRIKDFHKTNSLDIGMGVICVFLFFWNFLKFCWGIYTRRDRCQGLCRPHYRTVYDIHLEEEVNQYLDKGLKEIAEERAKAKCEPHLQRIKNNGNVSEEWLIISAPDFHLTIEE